MVKLTEVEDEHFAEKPATTKDDALLAGDDDDDYTDTGTVTSDCSSLAFVRKVKAIRQQNNSADLKAPILASTP
jgi:hypothetical protein